MVSDETPDVASTVKLPLVSGVKLGFDSVAGVAGINPVKIAGIDKMVEKLASLGTGFDSGMAAKFADVNTMNLAAGRTAFARTQEWVAELCRVEAKLFGPIVDYEAMGTSSIQALGDLVSKPLGSSVVATWAEELGPMPGPKATEAWANLAGPTSSHRSAVQELLKTIGFDAVAGVTRDLGLQATQAMKEVGIFDFAGASTGSESVAGAWAALFDQAAAEVADLLDPLADPAARGKVQIRCLNAIAEFRHLTPSQWVALVAIPVEAYLLYAIEVPDPRLAALSWAVFAATVVGLIMSLDEGAQRRRYGA
ncbi:hypothetical protein PO878_10200 [Iamia majanohamensis]|uniref:Uncharacterized protein n=1 Tax=Iamia majanohamensis TaxID=467976 RepID=A0AAF0BSY3_9ACTN|nr:hypothetical protein [Iamia majanohamensis]WCO69096.1 hypothetical protein PO878_10200 [Iamia majanohamensis]